jgi:hypothetical protein
MVATIPKQIVPAWLTGIGARRGRLAFGKEAEQSDGIAASRTAETTGRVRATYPSGDKHPISRAGVEFTNGDPGVRLRKVVRKT